MIIQRTNTTSNVTIIERVPNGAGFLWFLDGYFYRTLKAAKEASSLSPAIFTLFGADTEGVVKNPRNIDRTVWFPISVQDGTFYKTTSSHDGLVQWEKSDKHGKKRKVREIYKSKEL